MGAVTGRRGVVIGQRSSTTNRRGAVIRRSVVTGQRSAGTGRRGAVTDRRGVIGRRSAVTGQRSVFNGRRRAVTVTGRRSAVTDRMGVVIGLGNVIAGRAPLLTDGALSLETQSQINVSGDYHVSGASPRNFVWGNGFIGTQSHLPPKFSFSDFGHFILKMVENAKFRYLCVKKKIMKYHNFLGTSPADFSTAGDVSSPSPVFDAHATCWNLDNVCVKCDPGYASAAADGMGVPKPKVQGMSWMPVCWVCHTMCIGANKIQLPTRLAWKQQGNRMFETREWIRWTPLLI